MPKAFLFEPTGYPHFTDGLEKDPGFTGTRAILFRTGPFAWFTLSVMSYPDSIYSL